MQEDREKAQCYHDALSASSHDCSVAKRPKLQLGHRFLATEDHLLSNPFARKKDIQVIPHDIGSGKEQYRSRLENVIIVMKDLLIVDFNDSLWRTQQIGYVLSGRDADLDRGDIIGLGARGDLRQRRGCEQQQRCQDPSKWVSLDIT